MSDWRSLNTLLAMRLREYYREPSAGFFVVFFPVVMTLLLGHVLSGAKPESFPVGIKQESGDVLPTFWTKIEAELAKQPRLKVLRGDKQTLEQALGRGQIILYLDPSHPSGLAYHFDSANRQAAYARLWIDQTLQASQGAQPAITTMDVNVTAKGSRYVDFLVPGILAFSVMSTSLFGTGMVIVSNRRENLLKRYLATPMRPSLYILSHVLGRMVMLAVEASALLLTAYLVFDFRIAGSSLLFASVLVVGAAAFTALAIALGARTANVAFMNGLTNVIMLPMMILSGVWFARGHFPDWLHQLASYLPLTALVDALRKIALEGATMASLTRELSMLLGVALAATILATRIFRWR